jgi:hypothetical protein
MPGKHSSTCRLCMRCICRCALPLGWRAMAAAVWNSTRIVCSPAHYLRSALLGACLVQVLLYPYHTYKDFFLMCKALDRWV